MLNSILGSAIYDVMNSGSPSITLIEFTISSEQYASYSYTPDIIDALLVNQDFANNYTDDITLHFKIASADYVNLFDYKQDLIGELVIYYADQNGNADYTRQPIREKYRVILMNPMDIRKTTPDIDKRTTPDMHVALRLIEDDVYKLRHAGVNVILSKVTVEQAIRHVTSEFFNINVLHLVPPDNVYVYNHIVVPPFKKFREFYNWLQSEYGVYLNGINFYYSDSALYVYPPFNTAPTVTVNPVIVYQADKGAYAGAACFHKLSSDKIEIVTNEPPITKDLTTMGAENHGTNTMFLRSSKVVDQIVTVDAKKGPQFNADSALSITPTDNRLASSSVVNNHYAKESDNPYALASRHSMYNATLTRLNWPSALPFTVVPGEATIYYTDHSGVMMSQTGIIEKVRYNIGRKDRGPEGHMFVCRAYLDLRLTPDPIPTKTITS